MAELQEVQITEEKPLLPGQTPEVAKTHSVETPYGSVTFTVYGTPKPKRPAILTYHDVGLNSAVSIRGYAGNHSELRASSCGCPWDGRGGSCVPSGISVPISGPACGHDPLHPAVLKFLHNNWNWCWSWSLHLVSICS
ncbi:NDRG family member 2 [Phyllostomus discolor]|uniref:NDRG family member 2 n=1 Tax=Phyllostomus discolor TaxID=89673 RepID=A0A834BJ50_9CHIR|nr:NDRG family member 2 [Phyllostomus discolor]